MDRALLVASLMFASTASAQLAEKDDADLPTYHSRVLLPGELTLFGGVGADALLRDASVRLGTDVGLLSLGRWSIGLGLEASGGQCVTGCPEWAGRVTTRHAFGLVRAALHFPISAPTQNVESADVYALALGGVVGVWHDADQASLGRSVAPAFGVGLGSLHYPGGGDRLFVSGEVRVLWAETRTNLGAPATVGPVPYSLGGLSLMFSIGARI